MKKLIPFLMAILILFGWLFVREIRKSSQIVVKKSGVPLLSSMQYQIPIYAEDMMLGNPGAKTTVVEFTDFNCKQCRLIHKDIVEFVLKNPEKIRLVWKGYPISKIFTKADPYPHIASNCALLQNKFWEFTNLAMSDKNLTSIDLEKIASDLKLNPTSFKTCAILTTDPTATTTAIAKQFGFRDLPAIFIDNYYVNINEDISIKELLENFSDKD